MGNQKKAVNTRLCIQIGQEDGYDLLYLKYSVCVWSRVTSPARAHSHFPIHTIVVQQIYFTHHCKHMIEERFEGEGRFRGGSLNGASLEALGLGAASTIRNAPIAGFTVTKGFRDAVGPPRAGARPRYRPVGSWSVSGGAFPKRCNISTPIICDF